MNTTYFQTGKRTFIESGWFVAAMILLSMIISVLPFGGIALLPFRFFTTLVHELGHTVASLLVGESVLHIVINPDASGYMQHTVSQGALAQGFISSAGYLGAAVFGGALIVISGIRNASRNALLALAVIIGVVILVYIRDVFSFAVCAGLTIAIAAVSRAGSEGLNFFTLNFLAAQCGLNSVYDTLTLARLSLGAQRSEYSLGHSDADAVADIFLLPAVVWSVLWIVLSILILYAAIRWRNRIQTRRTTLS